jgi:mannosylglycerate hydrolase
VIAMSMTIDATDRKTLMLISHTHWDREWYLTFQQYRVKLVRLIDRLLDILDNNPAYAYFMLDGQTIVLEDYLEIRPDRRKDLERHIQSGRLLIGPWYILADMFLVSGESHIQNLLLGRRQTAEFGASMNVGYIPDPFGHISQMPQILRGFGLDSAIFWRGVPNLGQSEFIWLAPDGSQVDGAHLPGTLDIGGYCTALGWNKGVQAALEQLKAVRPFLTAKAKSGVVLLMNGNDHVEPENSFPATLQAVQTALTEQGLDYKVVHGTLPMYIQAVRETGIWNNPETPRHKGEFRDSQFAHLLPGVLSSRMPIKQKNSRIERLLERDAGLALGWASSLPGGTRPHFEPESLRGLYRQAWKTLLQNQPHDSICGCSVDQVHAEMDTRFAWAEQIGQEVRDESWRIIASKINTALPNDAKATPMIIFNAVPIARTEVATLSVTSPNGMGEMSVADAEGNVLPHRVSQPELELLSVMDIPAAMLAGMAAQVGDEGRFGDLTMADIEFLPYDDKEIEVKVVVVQGAASGSDPSLMKWASDRAQEFIGRGAHTFKVSFYKQTAARLEFLAKDVPPTGYKTFYLRPRRPEDIKYTSETLETPELIENEFYELTVDANTGLFSLRDKETGEVFAGLNRFRDGGDAGDEYNYSPPANDEVFDKLFTKPEVVVKRGAMESSIEVSAALELPFCLNDDRSGRSHMKNICSLTTVATLVPGQRRVDFATSFLNQVNDHRLQVVFPVGFATNKVSAEQAFDVVERVSELPPFDKTWLEDPQSTAPQKTFVSVYNAEKKLGATLINQGLPEYELVKLEDGNAGIAITLLRCTGWLSRSDLATRRGHAGPGLPTPGAQERGTHVFHYAFMPHKGDWLVANAPGQAYAFNHALTGVVTEQRTGEMPTSASFVEIQPRAVILSAVKPGEDGRSLIVRVWNPADRDIPEARLRFYRAPVRANITNLAEDTVLQELSLTGDNGNVVAFSLGAKKIATVRLEF